MKFLPDEVIGLFIKKVELAEEEEKSVQVALEKMRERQSLSRNISEDEVRIRDEAKFHVHVESDSTEECCVLSEGSPYFVTNPKIMISNSINLKVQGSDADVNVHCDDVYCEKKLKIENDVFIFVYKRFTNLQGLDFENTINFLFKNSNMTIPEKLNELFKLYKKGSKTKKKYEKYRRHYIKTHKK